MRKSVLHWISVTDYEIGKEENRQKQKENKFYIDTLV